MVKNLSLTGAGDSSDDNRLMDYMNLVYKEVYRETAEIYPTLLLVSETIALTAGVGAISKTPFEVKQIKNLANNCFLKPTTILQLEERYPALDQTGEPNWYYITGDATLNAYPVNDGSILVRHIPLPDELTTASPVTDIKIPKQYHDVLVWGTIVYACMDERDKALGMELNTAQGKYEIALNAFKTWLELRQTQEQNGTKAYLGG